MGLGKSILLGSAAALCTLLSAQAADLPSKKSAPVEYVRVCSQYGAGFFYVPGSDTCIQIGGRVRADTMYVETNNRAYDSFNFGAEARFNIDARTNTAYGTVRAYLRYALSRSTNNYGSGFNNEVTGIGSTADVDQAYIQFAGLTAGRTQSFFDFYADNYNFSAIRNSDVTTQVLAYTATFGNGWSLTLGIEDGNERRVHGGGQFTAPYGSGFIQGADPAGQSVPDAVGALLVEQDWGSAQISAALHQVRPASFSFTDPNLTTYDVSHDTEYGYALHGGVKINLPMIAPGDELWLEGAYAEGASSYIGANNYSLTQGNISLPISDAFIDANGKLQKAKGWSATLAFLHYWTPSVRQTVFGSYMKLDYGHNGYTSYETPSLGKFNVGFVDSSEWRIGTNVIWSPVKNFDIGVEALYTRLDPKGRVLSENNSSIRTISSDDSWQGRLRIQREF